MQKMKQLLVSLVVAGSIVSMGGVADAKTKAKFYDFSDQLIDGEIKKPTTLYTDARQQVRFERLLSLKKNFIDALLQTAKERVFK